MLLLFLISVANKNREETIVHAKLSRSYWLSTILHFGIRADRMLFIYFSTYQGYNTHMTYKLKFYNLYIVAYFKDIKSNIVSNNL